MNTSISTSANSVFLIEHRQPLWFDRKLYIDTVTVHVSSTEQKAIDWCNNNLGYDVPDNTWWFTIFAELIDDPGYFNLTLFGCIDKDGQVFPGIMVPPNIDLVYRETGSGKFQIGDLVCWQKSNIRTNFGGTGTVKEFLSSTRLYVEFDNGQSINCHEDDLVWTTG